jgi:hypothetical protein
MQPCEKCDVKYARNITFSLAKITPSLLWHGACTITGIIIVIDYYYYYYAMLHENKY